MDAKKETALSISLTLFGRIFRKVIVGGHTLMAIMTDILGNDNLSRISARSYSGAEINLITWLPHRDKIFILSSGEAPPLNHVKRNYNGADRFSHLSINLIDAAAPV